MSAVIFDLDGVLVESERHWRRAFADVANEVATKQRWRRAAPLTSEAMRSYTGGRVNETLRDIFTAIGHPEAAADGDLIDQSTKRAVEEASRGFLADPQPICASVEVARELAAKGMKLGVASSSSVDFIDTVLTYLGLADAFSAKQSALHLDNGKPDGEVYRRTLGQLGEAAADCIAIEDSAVGIRAAVDARLRCIGLHAGDAGDAPRELGLCVVRTKRLTRDDIDAAFAAADPY